LFYEQNYTRAPLTKIFLRVVIVIVIVVVIVVVNNGERVASKL
jgi:hypothetical protein